MIFVVRYFEHRATEARLSGKLDVERRLLLQLLTVLDVGRDIIQEAIDGLEKPYSGDTAITKCLQRLDLTTEQLNGFVLRLVDLCKELQMQLYKSYLIAFNKKEKGDIDKVRHDQV